MLLRGLRAGRSAAASAKSPLLAASVDGVIRSGVSYTAEILTRLSGIISPCMRRQQVLQPHCRHFVSVDSLAAETARREHSESESQTALEHSVVSAAEASQFRPGASTEQQVAYIHEQQHHGVVRCGAA